MTEAAKKARAKAARAYQEKNKDKLREYNRAYRLANKDKLKAYKKAWNDNNKDKVRAHQEAYWERKAALQEQEGVSTKCI